MARDPTESIALMAKIILHMQMRAHRYRFPPLRITVAAALMLALGACILAMLDWKPFRDNAVGTRPHSSPAAVVCLGCGVVESVRSMDQVEIGSHSGIAIRGFGDDLMSVLALVAG